MTSTAFRFDPVELPASAHALRPEVRAFLAEHRDRLGTMPGGFDAEFSRLVGERGWIGMTWPKRYGGHERSSLERYVVIEEMLAHAAPVTAHWVADRQSGPNILRFGTEEQNSSSCPASPAASLLLQLA